MSETKAGGNGSSSHDYVKPESEGGTSNIDDEDYCKKVKSHSNEGFCQHRFDGFGRTHQSLEKGSRTNHFLKKIIRNATWTLKLQGRS